MQNIRCNLLLLSSMVCLSVCASVGHKREPCKLAKPINMPFELLTQMGPRNQVLVGAPIPSWEWAILRAHIPPHYKVLREPVVSCRKSADRSTCGSGEDSCELKELCVRWGRRSFLGKGQFWSVVSPFSSLKCIRLLKQH